MQAVWELYPTPPFPVNTASLPVTYRQRGYLDDRLVLLITIMTSPCITIHHWCPSFLHCWFIYYPFVFLQINLCLFCIHLNPALAGVCWILLVLNLWFIWFCISHPTNKHTYTRAPLPSFICVSVFHPLVPPTFFLCLPFSPSSFVSFLPSLLPSWLPSFLSFLIPFLYVLLAFRPQHSEPSFPPRGVECSPGGSSSLRVSWRAPPEEGRNVDLEGYEIRYRPLANGLEPEPEAEMTQRVGSTDPLQILLGGLRKWTRYSVSVAAFTSEGSGPQSSSQECQTDEDGMIWLWFTASLNSLNGSQNRFLYK